MAYWLNYMWPTGYIDAFSFERFETLELAKASVKEGVGNQVFIIEMESHPFQQPVRQEDFRLVYDDARGWRVGAAAATCIAEMWQ